MYFTHIYYTGINEASPEARYSAACALRSPPAGWRIYCVTGLQHPRGLGSKAQASAVSPLQPELLSTSPFGAQAAGLKAEDHGTAG
jgi:hypothetical protein